MYETNLKIDDICRSQDVAEIESLLLNAKTSIDKLDIKSLHGIDYMSCPCPCPPIAKEVLYVTFSPIF